MCNSAIGLKEWCQVVCAHKRKDFQLSISVRYSIVAFSQISLITKKCMKSDYERVSQIGFWKNLVLILSTVLTLALTLDEKYKLSIVHESLKDYVELIIGINSIFVVLYIWFDIRENIIFSKAERGRTLQYVDNSFDTNFGGKKVEGYFTQDKLGPGFYKACVNCYENTYHTFAIAKEMQYGTYAKAVVVIIVLMFSATVGDKGIVRYLTEAILPLAAFQSALKLSFFVSRLDTLKETFANFFNSIKDSGFQNREPEALKNVVTYETTLAWASIPLDSKIFLKMREELAKEWEELKQQQHIKQETT
jgi:hypothetical protein